MEKIAVLTPTRERFQPCSRMVHSALDKALFPTEVQMWLYVDDDDPQKGLYEQHLSPMDQVHIVNGPSDGVGRAWNRLTKAAHAHGCRWYMMGNDDLLWETGTWDEVLRERTKIYPDGIYCAFFADGIQHAKHAAFPIVTDDWVKAVGYFVPEIFRFGCHDTWITRVAAMLDRLLYMPEVMVRHRHHSRGGVRDKTTARNTKHWPRDQAVFKKPETVAMREADAAKLRPLLRDPVSP